MSPTFKPFAFAVLAVALCAPGTASACGTPSDRWYRDVSDIIFDGFANCKPAEETCRIRVSRVLKNPLHLSVQRRLIDIDYYSWYDEFYEQNPGVIVLACGVPRFKPDAERFRARFYANLDEETGELVVRRYVVREDTSG